MKHILFLLLMCTTVLSGSILDMMNQFRNGLVHRPGCGWSRQEACVWLTGGGSMLDLTMAFREEALHEGIATKIVFGRVCMNEAQVKAWLPWKVGKTDVQMDDFGGGGNGILMEDGRYEFDMAWLRCLVHYAPDFGTSEPKSSEGMQWIDVFPALIGCERVANVEMFWKPEDMSSWRQEIEHDIQIIELEGKEACIGFSLDNLLEKRRLFASQWMNTGNQFKADYQSQSIPGYASSRILGLRPVQIIDVYGEYDELPQEYVSQIVVEIVRNDKIVCQLTMPQKDLQTVELTWLTGHEGQELNCQKGQKCADMKLLPKLSAGEQHMVGRGPYVWGEPLTVRFRRMTGNVLHEEVWDCSLCGEKVVYALSMGHGECETMADLSSDGMLASWLRKRHDVVRQQVAGLWEEQEESSLCVSKIVEGIRLTENDGTIAGYYYGAGELAGNRLVELDCENSGKWVEKAAGNEVSADFLLKVWFGKTVQSPWFRVVEMADAGQIIRIESVVNLPLCTEVFGTKEVVVGNDICWAGNNGGALGLTGQVIAYQMAVVETEEREMAVPNELLEEADMQDDMMLYLFAMLCGLDGNDGWLGNCMAGRLTAMGLFCRLTELRDACPKIETFSLEHGIFQRGKAIMKLKTTGGELWTIQVSDSKGNIVKGYNGNGCNETVLWDGCDESGAICKDDTYQFAVTVSHGEFHVSCSIGGIMDMEPPDVQFVAWLEKENGGKNVLHGEYLVEDENLGVMTAQLREIVSGCLLEIQPLEESRGKLSFTIQEDLDGVYEWTVLAEDKAGNQAVASTSIKSGAYSSDVVWSLQKPDVEELKTDGVRAELSVPLDGTEIDTEIVQVMGTADADGGVQYMLRLWDAEGHLLSCQAEERKEGWLLKYIQNSAVDDYLVYKLPRRQAVVMDGLLGLLDVSGLSNGRYQLELVVIGEKGTANSLRDIYLEKRITNGVFEFSEIDGRVAIGGVEMKVQRSYSSGELNDGEMGFGWTWSYSATGGEVDDEREIVQDVVGNTVSVRCGGSRDVVLTLPNGRRCTYRFSLEEGGGWSFCYYANWTGPSDVKAILRPTVSNKLMTLPGLDPYWEATGTECDWERYDFPGFVLTDVDGTEYEYMRDPLGEAALLGDDGGCSLQECYGDLKLATIRKRNGESWRLNDQNILYVNAKGEIREVLRMERDEKSRIVKLDLQDDHHVLYHYDEQGNLCQVIKVVDGKETLYRQYQYEDERFPHHLTGVVDGRGICLMALEYDVFGGYCGMRSAEGANATAVRDALERYELQTDCYGHETLFGYDEKGQMTLKIEADGGRTQYVYDDAGREVRKTDPLGRSVVQAYDADGNLLSRRTAGGEETLYYYNGDGQCTKLVDAAGRVIEAEYDASGHANKVVTPTGTVMKRRFSKEGVLEAELDENGEELAFYEHDAEGRTSAVTDYVGGMRQEFAYDGHGKLSMLHQRSFNPETGEVETYGLFYERDDDGNVVSTHDSLGEWTLVVYDDEGCMTEQRTSQGLHARYRYDTAGRCVEEVDVKRQTVGRVVYDIGGRQVAQTGMEPVELVGGKVPETIVFTKVWLINYDAVGRPIGKSQRTNVSIRLVKTAEDCYCCEVVNDGEVLADEQTEHDLAGQVTKEISALGYETRYLYDQNGNCVAVTDHYGHCQRREFDKLGHVVSAVDGMGHETRMDYDEAGRLRMTRMPDGSEWMVVHDKEGNVVERTDGEGLVTKMEYAFHNRPTRVVLLKIDGDNPIYKYDYDSRGSLVTVMDPLERVRRYGRDALGRISLETSPGGYEKRYEYFGRGGQMTSMTEGGGRHTEWRYDELGRVVKQSSWRDGQVEEADIVREYAYDGYGRLACLSSGNEVRTYSYDIDGQLVGMEDNDEQSWEAIRNAEGAVIQLRGVGTEIGYARGQHGRLDGLVMQVGCGDVQKEPWEISYDYNANGQVVRSMSSDGWEKEYAYDACGRCNGVNVRQGDDDVYLAQYKLDRNGRKVEAIETGSRGERKWRWGYDELGRLVEEHVEKADGTQVRDWFGVYDTVGNLLEERLDKNGILSCQKVCEFDDDDRLTKMTVTTDTGRYETQYEWNGNGELVKAEMTGCRTETREWSWNADGRLEGVDIIMPSCRLEVSYDYDLDGVLKTQTVRRHENGQDYMERREFRFESVTHGGLPMLLEMTEELDGIQTKRSLLHGHELEGWIEDGRICHTWADAHGGIRGMSCGGDAVHFSYDAWGAEDVTHDGFGYAGEWQDAATGLVYLRGRFYWPEIRRFISADRHPADFENPQGWHRYVYCLNDPVNCRDPQGEFVMTATMIMTLKLVAFYACFKVAVTAYYDLRHADMMRSMLQIRKRYHENASVVVHGVTEHDVNWTEKFSDTLEKVSGNQDMYEFLWSGFQCSAFVLFIPNPLSHRIASWSLTYFLIELSLKGYSNLNVIAHSWGTVLSRDAMNSSGLSFGLWATMGSPLGLTKPLFRYRKWQNYYAPADMVTTLAPLLWAMGFTSNSIPLSMQTNGLEQYQTMSWDIITSHSSYWTDPTVFNDILTVLKWQ